MTEAELRKELASRKEALLKKQHHNQTLAQQLDALQARFLEAAGDLDTAKEASTFLDRLALARRGGMSGKLQGLLTEAVQFIYGQDYRVTLDYGHKNNRSSLEIKVVRKTENGDVSRDMEGFGGGLADTISVPLRLMVLIGAKQTDRVCVLDECYKHMDNERVELVGDFLRQLSAKLDMQIIMCSHHEVLKAKCDALYEVTETGGKSAVRKIERCVRKS